MSHFATKILKAEFIVGNAVIPIVMLLGYCIFFIAVNNLLSPYLPVDNVNYHFSCDLVKLAFPALLASLLVVLVLGIHHGKVPGPISIPRQRSGIIAKSLLIALLPLAPVIRYLLSNQDILSLLDVIVILAASLGISVVFVVAIPILLSKYGSFRLLVSIACAFVFTIVNMAAVSSLLHWLEEGSTKIQIPLYALVLAFIWLLLGLQKKTDLIFVVAAFLVSNSALTSLTQSEPVAVGGTQAPLLAELMAGKKPVDTPNIYLLVYDSYVPNETMLSYGIDNSEQEAFLAEQGFTLYPRTYSVAADSLGSMNRVFNVSLVHNGHSRDGVAGNGLVHELFRSLDYQVQGIFPFDFMFRGVGPQYDYYIPHGTVPSYQLLFSGMWLGEFRYDIGLETISYEEYVQAKREVFTSPGKGPAFLYTHTPLPGHSQFSGICRPNETELYASDLLKANEEMRQDIASITANDPDAILIVAGDHGPYLTKNCTALKDHYALAEITRVDIQNRHGTFLAIRWPAEDYSEYDEITVLQDLFPAVFAWMYRDSLLLEAKIEPNAPPSGYNGGVGVNDGILVGGADEGEPLYLSSQ